jgi:hypothetical protein
VNKPASLGIVLGLGLALFACGSNDTNKPTSSNAGGGSPSAGKGGAGKGGAGKGAAAGGAAGSTASGTKAEGDACNNSVQCSNGLSCVLSSVGNSLVQTCGKGCASDTDCSSGQVCNSDTNAAADMHCVDVVTEPMMPCGPSTSSVCKDPLTCVFTDLQNGPIPAGTCFNICLLPGGSTASLNDPSAVLMQCPGDLVCAQLDDPDIGLCAKPAARSGACGFDIGALCGAGDLCITDVSANESICYQDCTQDSKSCAAGTTCTPVDAMTSFCM